MSRYLAIANFFRLLVHISKYFSNNSSCCDGNDSTQTSTIQGYQRFHPQNVTPQIWYISVLVLLPTSLFIRTRFIKNKHPNVKFAVYLLANLMLSFCLSLLHSICTNELAETFDEANVIVFLIMFLLSLLAAKFR